MKKIGFFLLTLTIVFFVGLYLLSQGSDNKISKFIKDNFSYEIKYLLKKTIFYVPNLKREYENLQKEISQLNIDNLKLKNNYDLLFSQLNLGKKSENNINDLYLINVVAPFTNEKNDYQIKSGYLDIYKNYVFLINGKGNIYYFLKDEFVKNRIDFKVLNSDINNFISTTTNFRWSGIKDIKIVNDEIFLSITSEIKKNCYSTSLIKSKIKFDELNFKYVFKNQDCVEIKEGAQPFKFFNGYQTGGRIDNIDEKLYLTIGDYNAWEYPQVENKFIGKIIEINLLSEKIKIISSGHRNPQGLFIHSFKDKLLISTEHGPKGGDEINMIDLKLDLKENNYGWPIASYGVHYDVVPINSFTKKYAPLKNSHEKNGFKEPIFTFKEQIGISQIIKNFFSNKNQYFITSLRAKKIYLIEFDKNLSKPKIINEYDLKERIRDIIYDYEYNSYYLLLEDTPYVSKMFIKKL